MPNVHDYSGDNYGRSPRKTKLSKEHVKSHRCRDCNTLRYVTPLELTRAARPRCLACGGTLVEIEVSIKRELGGKLEQKNRAKLSAKSLAEIRESPKCWSCGFVADSPQFLAVHLVNHSECRYEYKADGKIVNAAFLPNTACWHTEKSRIIATMISLDGKVIEVGRFGTQREAKELVDRLNQMTAVDK